MQHRFRRLPSDRTQRINTTTISTLTKHILFYTLSSRKLIHYALISWKKKSIWLRCGFRTLLIVKFCIFWPIVIVYMSNSKSKLVTLKLSHWFRLEFIWHQKSASNAGLVWWLHKATLPNHCSKYHHRTLSSRKISKSRLLSNTEPNHAIDKRGKQTGDLGRYMYNTKIKPSTYGVSYSRTFLISVLTSSNFLLQVFLSLSILDCASAIDIDV